MLIKKIMISTIMALFVIGSANALTSRDMGSKEYKNFVKLVHCGVVVAAAGAISKTFEPSLGPRGDRLSSAIFDLAETYSDRHIPMMDGEKDKVFLEETQAIIKELKTKFPDTDRPIEDASKRLNYLNKRLDSCETFLGEIHDQLGKEKST